MLLPNFKLIFTACMILSNIELDKHKINLAILLASKVERQISKGENSHFTLQNETNARSGL